MLLLLKKFEKKNFWLDMFASLFEMDNLNNRCKVDKCYVSYLSWTSSSIDSRDVKDNVKALAELW